MTQTKFTPGPMEAVMDMDGRHHAVPILTYHPSFVDTADGTKPYHPLIGQVFHGRGHADKATAEATARLWASAPDLLEALENIKHAAQYGLNALPAGDPFRRKIQKNIDTAEAAIKKATTP